MSTRKEKKPTGRHACSEDYIAARRKAKARRRIEEIGLPVILAITMGYRRGNPKPMQKVPAKANIEWLRQSGIRGTADIWRARNIMSQIIGQGYLRASSKATERPMLTKKGRKLLEQHGYLEKQSATVQNQDAVQVESADNS